MDRAPNRGPGRQSDDTSSITAPEAALLHLNRSAADHSPLLLVRLAVKPLALPPFPLDRLANV
ncbi:MAG: hypothetical protein ABIW50_05600 [Candidatus Limnocylindria bacterium]